MKQDWFCEQCLADGTVSQPLHVDVWTMVNALEAAHHRESPNCPTTVTRLRVRNSELMSKAEWRKMRSDARNKQAVRR